jgi:hypothetical protein
MEKITKIVSQKIRNNLLFIVLIFSFVPSSFAQKYNDQIVVEMLNAAKTMYDMRVFSLIRNAYEKQTLIDPFKLEWITTSFDNERDAYIDQFLVQDYVSENDMKIRPTKTEIDQSFNTLNKVFQSDAAKKTLEDLGISTSEIKQWIENRLMFEKFLTTFIQERVMITDQKLLAHHASLKSIRFGNKNYADVEQKVRQDLTSALIDEEFQKWVEQERRRKKIILKPVQPS